MSPRLKSRRGCRPTLGRDDGQAVEIDAQMLHHRQHLEVGDVAGRRHDGGAGQRLRCVFLGDTKSGLSHAVVGLGVGDGDADQLQIGAVVDKVGERGQALRVGDVDAAALHRLGHLAAALERNPVDRHTDGVTKRTVLLSDLVRGRPLGEVGDIQLFQVGIDCGRLVIAAASSNNKRKRSKHKPELLHGGSLPWFAPFGDCAGLTNCRRSSARSCRAPAPTWRPDRRARRRRPPAGGDTTNRVAPRSSGRISNRASRT